MLTVPDIITKTYEKWCEAVEPEVGTNVHMENSVTVSDFPCATLFFMGLPTGSADLAGEEAGINPSLQTDIYTSGQLAVSKAYEIDNLSHEALLGMGYQRSYGPELIQSTDPSIKRLTSRYTRLIGYGETI